MLPPLAFLDELADLAAAETLPRFRSRMSVANKREAGFDPVTEADHAAETAIRRAIEAAWPEHGILGEEHGATGTDRELVWVIDPIDGTRAFISGLPVWGTLIGLYHQGRAVMGMMDQPFTGERFVAGPDGAFYSRDGSARTPLNVRNCEALEHATLFTTAPELYAGDAAGRFGSLRGAVRLTRFGCDCYAFALLAAGHIDIVVESGLQPYDIAALIPIIEQAGGIVTTWDGGRPEGGGDIVACGSRRIHAAAMAILTG
jgi:histidinol phosphatase-like enzyme (inositol monophosphatase family)